MTGGGAGWAARSVQPAPGKSAHPTAPNVASALLRGSGALHRLLGDRLDVRGPG